jgi:hypothetical protein|uniref:Uncharacterized protein n=1 Tax=viral metagenome TaxID=1070528 RepID=A0A6C0D6E1_9ZZZZ
MNKTTEQKNIENIEKKERENEKFLDLLNQYFRYKDKYENAITKEKKKISQLDGLSWNEKRAEFLKRKPKCINCKRPVGSIFSTKVEKDGRHLIALCGDRKNPCQFNININLGIVENIRDSLENDEEILNKHKRDIIVDKNDLLFGYISPDQAVSRFDIIKEAVSEDTKVYEFTLQSLQNILDNDEKKEELLKLNTEFYNNLENYRSIIKQFETTGNNQLIVDAVDLYVNTMQPRANKIMHEKYNYNGVEYNEDNNTFHFLQIPIMNEKLEWDLSDNGQKVISFKVGLEKQTSNKKIPSPFSPAIPDVKSKMQETNDKITDVTSNANEDKFKLKSDINSKESSTENSYSDDDESDNESDNYSDDDSDSEEPQPKIKIHPNLLSDGTIAASEANRLKYKVELINGELIATNTQTNETYKVTAGK